MPELVYQSEDDPEYNKKIQEMENEQEKLSHGGQSENIKCDVRLDFQKERKERMEKGHIRRDSG